MQARRAPERAAAPASGRWGWNPHGGVPCLACSSVATDSQGEQLIRRLGRRLRPGRPGPRRGRLEESTGGYKGQAKQDALAGPLKTATWRGKPYRRPKAGGQCTETEADLRIMPATETDLRTIPGSWRKVAMNPIIWGLAGLGVLLAGAMRVA